MMRLATRVSWITVVAAVLLAGTGVARAQKMKVLELDLVEPPKEDKKAEPVYRAVVDYAVPGLAADKFQLKDLDAEPTEIAVEAEKVTTFPESSDKLALVVLIQGDVLWMGNETYIPEEDPDQLQGAFSGLPDAIDSLTKAGPPGSTGALLSYAGGSAQVKYPPGEIGGLSGALGVQQDYKEIGVPFIVGVDEAYKKLTEMSGRRVMVVFGDGTGQAEDLSGPLDERIKKLEALGAEVYTIYFAAAPTDNPVPKNNMKRLGYSGFYEAPQRDNFKSKTEDIVAKVSARYYVDFPAMPFATEKKGARELIVFVNDEEGEPKEMPTVAKPKPPEESSLWWLWLLIILIIVIVIVVIVIKLKNREPAPPPIVEMPEEPPAPGPAAPAKTVMLGIGGDDEGFPIVGWIVPITGPNQFQTFKLHQGQTIVGTAAEAHIIVQDTFMSTSHAEITCSPAGFILKDLGSTNGTFVNQKRVDTHELFDNDVFTLGKTDFKFKSIN
jgi:hypothetical protein